MWLQGWMGWGRLFCWCPDQVVLEYLKPVVSAIPGLLNYMSQLASFYVSPIYVMTLAFCHSQLKSPNWYQGIAESGKRIDYDTPGPCHIIHVWEGWNWGGWLESGSHRALHARLRGWNFVLCSPQRAGRIKPFSIPEILSLTFTARSILESTPILIVLDVSLPL